MSKDLNKPFLESCPFCGAKAELVKVSTGYGDKAIKDSFMVCCTHCKAKTEIRSSDVRMSNAGVIEVRKNGADEVIQLWNRRTKFDLVDYYEREDM